MCSDVCPLCFFFKSLQRPSTHASIPFDSFHESKGALFFVCSQEREGCRHHIRYKNLNHPTSPGKNMLSRTRNASLRSLLRRSFIFPSCSSSSPKTSISSSSSSLSRLFPSFFHSLHRPHHHFSSSRAPLSLPSHAPPEPLSHLPSLRSGRVDFRPQNAIIRERRPISTASSN